jgi:hypothetical protein
MQFGRTVVVLLSLCAVAATQVAAQQANPAKGGQANKGKKGKLRPEPQPRPSLPVSYDMSAMKKVIGVIQDSVDLGPTLVVWVLDRTTSAHDIVRDVTGNAAVFYGSPEASAWSSAAGKPLLTAVVAFDDKVEFVLDPPSHDVKKVKAALEELSTSAGSRELPFTAIKQAIEKYLPLRTKERREIVLVVVTDEAGDDTQVAEELLEPLRKHAIPLYAIGLPAPWGQSNPFATNPLAVPASKDDLVPTVGPESVMPERVDIDNWVERLGSRVNTDIVDSGFGPFAMERLCRASRGKFFAVRAEAGSRNVSARSWPPGNEMRFDESVVAKYAPDYVSVADYQKLLNENKARGALSEAARLGKLKTEGQPGTRFPKDAEAKMAKKMSEAQQFAARNLPPVDRFYDVLIKGEADRAKLTSPRWQAEYDLAAGRVIANKVRLDGYNSMIAALKRGKTFQKPDSKVWMLEPADKYETESTIKKMAEKAEAYLKRVVQEHPGTPWAKIAEEELKAPLGWTWKETQ